MVADGRVDGSSYDPERSSSSPGQSLSSTIPGRASGRPGSALSARLDRLTRVCATRPERVWTVAQAARAAQDRPGCWPSERRC